MTSADPKHAHSDTAARAWRAFRRWRRSRPFWGGLLLTIAGLEIFGTTQMSLGGLSFQMGPSGFLSWLIPTILVTCGVLIWATPQHRMFYAIIGSMTAVFSLIAVNLGGFFIGMLLGMVGGGLAFAWTRVPAAPAEPSAESDTKLPRPRDPREPTSDEPADTESLPGVGSAETEPSPAAGDAEPSPTAGSADTDTLPATGSADTEPSPAAGTGSADAAPVPRDAYEDRSARSPRHAGPGLYVVALLLLSVAVAGPVTLRSDTPAAAAPPCPPVRPGATAPGATPTPTGTAAPTATPSAGAPSSEKDRDDEGNLLTEIIDGIGRVLGIGGDRAAPADEPTATPSASPSASPSGARGAAGPGGQAGRPGVCPKGKNKPEPGPDGVPRLALDPSLPAVAKQPSRLTGSKVTMRGLRMDGITKLRTVDGGTIEVLKFSMRKAVTEDFLLKSPGPGGRSMLFRTDELAVQGDVVFYASRFVGWLGPIKLTLTPSSPIPPDGIPLALPLISFDKPEMDLVFVETNTLTGRPSLKVTLG